MVRVYNWGAPPRRWHPRSNFLTPPCHSWRSAAGPAGLWRWPRPHPGGLGHRCRRDWCKGGVLKIHHGTETLKGWLPKPQKIQDWLVVFRPTPLKNMSQLGWWNSQYMESHKTCSKPPTSKGVNSVMKEVKRAIPPPLRLSFYPSWVRSPLFYGSMEWAYK